MGRKTKKIKRMERLIELASDRKAVWFHGWSRPLSASFVVGMPLRTVAEFMDRGLYEYKAKGK